MSASLSLFIKLLRQLISSYKTLPEKKKKNSLLVIFFILDLYWVESSLTRSFQKLQQKDVFITAIITAL